MNALHLDSISPVLRNKILSYKIDSNYDTKENPIIYNYDLNEYNESLRRYKPDTLSRMMLNDHGTFDGIKSEGNTNVDFKITDGYYGNFRRDYYPKQWDKRKTSPESRTPNIYFDIEGNIEDKQQINSLWKERDGYDDYIDYTNKIFMQNTPSGRTKTGSRTTQSDPVNILAAMVRGDGIGLSLNSDGGGVGVVTDLNITQTLAGRIFTTATGIDTPMGRFGVKAAAISMANNALAKSGKFVSGLAKESIRWATRNTIGKLIGSAGDKLFGDEDFDISGLGNSRITNPPGIMDDILSASGINNIINPIAGGLGIGGLLDSNNVTQTATSSNDGKYVKINVEDVLVSSEYNSPNFDLFVNGGKITNIGGGKELVKRHLFKKNEYKDLPDNFVSESDFREYQQSQLLDWTGTINAIQIYSHLSKNKYAPNYTGQERIRKKIIGDSEINKYPLNFDSDNDFDKPIGYFPKSSGFTKWEYARQILNWKENQINENKFIIPPNSGSYVHENDIYISTRMRNTTPESKSLFADNSLLSKTHKLFNNKKIGTMVSRFFKDDEKPTEIQSAIDPIYGMSKGRALRNKLGAGGLILPFSITDGGYLDPWCRVWTWERQYRNVLNAIRPFVTGDETDPGNTGKPMTMEELHNNVKFIRPFLKEFIDNTSLQNNGLPKIAPYATDYTDWIKDFDFNKETRSYTKTNRWKYNRNYMFSIENLAWKDLDLENLLCPSQIGPNGGRIYWFSPLNLTFDESTQVKLNTEEFIGRGEPMYSYINTSRTGTLKFTMIVDHSSFHEYMSNRNALSTDKKDDAYQGILRFDAGCDIPIFEEPGECPPIKIIEERTTTYTDIIEPEYTPEIEGEEYELVRVYFPNDFSGVNFHHGKVVDGGPGGGGGGATMDYLYHGGGSNNTGEKPYIWGDDFGIQDAEVVGHHGWGYEMDWDKNNPKIANKSNAPMTLSNIDTKSPSPDGNVMTTWDGQHKETKMTFDRKGSAESMKNLYETFATNMHITDPITGFYTRPKGKKINPSKRTDVLPRVQYKEGVSNWDVGNYHLNAKKASGAKLSFAAFYEICGIKNKDNSPHADDWGIYNFEEIKKILERADEITVAGSASKDGYKDDNKELATFRAIALIQFIRDNVGIDITNMPHKPNFKFKLEQIYANDSEGKSSDLASKSFRYAYIKIKKHGAKSEKIANTGGEVTHIGPVEEIVSETYKVRSVTRYDEEKDFYEYVDKHDDLTWSNVKDRYNKYIPGLWSCTPEGFNARLTFLQQCTRQGPTNSATDNTNVTNISNLSFGRPPVCILKIGDFIQSKIFIQTLNIDFGVDGAVQFDLNPEGIGIQPMVANINMTFVYMGGQDITGAIAKLQNAVSFNYYANASVYDDRADSNAFIPQDTKKTTREWRVPERGMGVDGHRVGHYEDKKGIVFKEPSILFDVYNYQNGNSYFGSKDITCYENTSFKTEVSKNGKPPE